MRHFLSLGLLCLFSAAASAQVAYERDDTWEFGFNLINLGSVAAAGPEGSSLDVDSELGWGMSGGYNFNNHFAVQFDFSYASPSYDATFRIEDTNLLTTISHTLDVSNFHFKGTYYILEGPLTPFVELGFGWTAVDSNVADGPPTTGCWWDPWWGYICTNFYDTYEKTENSYTGAIGVRWDLSPSIMLRADYGILDIDSEAAADDMDPETIRVAFGWRF